MTEEQVERKRFRYEGPDEPAQDLDPFGDLETRANEVIDLAMLVEGIKIEDKNLELMIATSRLLAEEVLASILVKRARELEAQEEKAQKAAEEARRAR